MAFLDYDGLTRFWGKVKDYIASHSGGRGNAAVFVGTCDTAASTAEKAVTCPDYDSLVVGDKIYVTFTYGNSVSGYYITLNVNNKGAKSIRIKRQGNLNYLQEPANLGTGGEYLFTYDGTYWILTASNIVYTQNIGQNDITQRPLIVGNYRPSNSGFSTQSLSETYDAYYYYGKLYVGGDEVLTDGSYNFDAFLGKIEASDIMHDQYLQALPSSDYYRAVLRLYFVTPEGYIYEKDQNDSTSFLSDNYYYVSITAYDSSNNIIETYYDDAQLEWGPWSWYEYDYNDERIMTNYWLEFPFVFDPSDSDIDHISVSFSGLNSKLYMYNSNQNLNFNCHPTNHGTVEIKNVGLVYAQPDWADGQTSGFIQTGLALPTETVNVPQIWAEDLDEAMLVRGYGFQTYDRESDRNYWQTTDYSKEILNTLVIYNNNLYYTNGYFLIPITESSGNYVQSNQGIANSGKVLAVNSSGVVEPVSMNAVQSNQGVANAGKFLVVNSSGTVEPVSMTAWQGGSY